MDKINKNMEIKINQKNLFGKNLVNFITKERTQGFFAGILTTIFLGIISGIVGIIIEYIKTSFLCK